jgi:hypothetical protein
MKYYSLEPVLSRGGKLSFVIGHRGAGKTYAFKEWALKDFLATGAQWVYIRRGTDEIVASRGSLWDDIVPQAGYQVKTRGYKCFIRPQIPLELEGKEKNQWEEANPWRPFGYFIALTDAQIFKSASFPLVDKICFDEFIIENTRRQYIPDEANSFMGLISTIARNRKVKTVALSNAGFIDNPYFRYYQIKSSEFDKASFLRRNNGAVVFEYYIHDNVDELLKTDIAQISNREYQEYALESKFKDGGDQLIKCKPNGATPQIRISRDGSLWLTVYSKPEEGRWIGYGGANSDYPAYSMDRWKPINEAMYSTEVITILKDGLNDRTLSFESADVRAIFLGWLKEQQR